MESDSVSEIQFVALTSWIRLETLIKITYKGKRESIFTEQTKQQREILTELNIKVK